MQDRCDRGLAIRAWDNPVYVDRNVDESELEGTELQWVAFRGRFGNIEKMVRREGKNFCLQSEVGSFWMAELRPDANG